MAEPETSGTAAAELLARLYGKTHFPALQRHYGGDPAIEGKTEWLIYRALADFLDRNPLERHRVADELRAEVKVSADYLTNALTTDGWLSHVYPQGSYAIDTHLRAARDHDLDIHFCDYAVLDTYRSDVASLARFSQRVEHATFYMFVAIDGQVERSHWHKPRTRQTKAPKSWYGALARHSFSKWECTRELLTKHWAISEPGEALYRTAFWSLCELTPADTQLKHLFEQDRFRACRELVRHVDVYADQLQLATGLAEDLAKSEGHAINNEDATRLETIQRELLEQAGDALTLTQAAERLGMTRQGLHKKIKTGAALGLMIGDTFVVPVAQFVDGDSGTAVVAHLRDVLSLFTTSGAGTWSALQYLIEPDPALSGRIPLDQLKAGETKAVIAAARAFLGLDEG